MKRLAFTLALLTLLAPLARAAGINLSWNDCGTFGQCNQSFACDSNGPGVFTLVGSFVPPEGTTAVVGIGAVIDLISQSPVLPDWWMFRNVGYCRSTALGANFDFMSGPTACTDYWSGQAQGGLAGYLTGPALNSGATPNRARILIAGAIAPALASALDPNTEYYGFNLRISKAKTVGTGACGGCDVPVGMMLQQVQLTQPVGVGDFTLTNPLSSNFAAWQNGWFTVYDVGYNCPPVPARNKTWGAIKSLYR